MNSSASSVGIFGSSLLKFAGGTDNSSSSSSLALIDAAQHLGSASVGHQPQVLAGAGAGVVNPAAAIQLFHHTPATQSFDLRSQLMNTDVVGAVLETTVSKFDSKLTHQEDIAIGIFMSFIGCVALLLNFRLLSSFWRDRKTLQPPEFFFVNLCLADLITILFAYPLSNISFYSHRWMWGERGCIFYGSTSYFSAIAGILSLMAVAIMRYVKTCRAEYGIRLTSAAAKKSIGLIYAIALFWTALPLTGWGSYDVEPYGLSCTLNWWSDDIGDIAQMVLACTFICFIPATIMVFCYGSIIRTVREANQRMASYGVNRNKGPNETRLTIISAILCLGMMVAWFPYTIVSLATAIGGKDSLPMRLTVVPVLMAKCSHGYNPLIYFMMASDKRMKANGLVSCCVNRRTRNSTASTESNAADILTQIQGDGQQSTMSPARIPLSVLEGADVSSSVGGDDVVPLSSTHQLLHPTSGGGLIQHHEGSSGKPSLTASTSSEGPAAVMISANTAASYADMGRYADVLDILQETVPPRRRNRRKAPRDVPDRVRSEDGSLPVAEVFGSSKRRQQRALSTPALIVSTDADDVSTHAADDEHAGAGRPPKNVRVHRRMLRLDKVVANTAAFFFETRAKSDSVLVGKCSPASAMSAAAAAATGGAMINEKSISDQGLLASKAVSVLPFAAAGRAAVDACGTASFDENGKLLYLVGPGEFWL